MNELNNLREMIVKGMNEMRSTKRKTTSTFGVWHWLFALTVQCNKAIKEVEKMQAFYASDTYQKGINDK